MESKCHCRGRSREVKRRLQCKIDGLHFSSHSVQLVLEAGAYSTRTATIQVKQSNGTVRIPGTLFNYEFFTLKDDPNQSSALTMTFRPEEYVPFLKSRNYFTIKTFVKIKETNQVTLLTKQFNFVEPPILLDFQGTLSELKVGAKGKVKVTFTNPLPQPLHNVILKVEGQVLVEILVQLKTTRHCPRCKPSIGVTYKGRRQVLW